MKVRVEQLNPIIGDFEGNLSGIFQALEKAEQDEVELLVLPELTVCGYLPMDLLERPAFLRANYQANRKVVEATSETAVLFGGVTKNTSDVGRKCFNSALLAHKGALIAEVHKTLLPTYDVFDELRYFEENTEFECVEFKGAQLGITICEDIWYNENDVQYHTYEINPAKELVELGADAIFNISASPFTKTKPASRQEMLQNHAKELNVPIFYANQVGANTELVSDGDSMVLDAKSNVIARAELFKEAHIDVEWDVEKKQVKNIGPPFATIPTKQEGIFRALVKGLQDYLGKTKISDKVILGLSGGIDSALVACIAKEALGQENVLAVTMPSEFSSKGSITDSVELASNLGIALDTLPVKSLYEEYLRVLKSKFKDTSFGVAEENLQSRIRGVLLMAISNKFGHMLVNTGNKSEMATGYCTLYGDMNGGLAIISDVYKTEVYDICHWLNKEFYQQEIIPNNILNKSPSAELRPDQKDADSLPNYDILDPILEAYIEKQLSSKEIIDLGFDESTVQKVLKMVDRNEYKRFQAVPGLKVSTKSFGTGRRWPLVQGWSSSEYR
ncbi:MAG: NAD+ synthase [Balneolaceae bacterium]|nr:NAD+ synthase [Balneolaceae bacterium]